MSFNKHGVKENRKYCCNDVSKQLTDIFWSELLQLFYNTEYTNGERKIILERWAEMLSAKGPEYGDFDGLIDDAKRLVLRLYKMKNDIDDKVIMDFMACLVVKDRFTAEQLNDFLGKYQFQYYYTTEGTWEMFQSTDGKKKELIFISHSSEDKEYVCRLVEFLEDIGVEADQIFCSSIPEYAVPLDEDIYDFIKSRFLEYDLRVLYILSENYYKSAACLNEMGATWVLQKKYTSILLPGFIFEQIKGAVNPTKIGINLSASNDEIEYRLSELRDNLQAEFGLKGLTDRQWKRYSETFIDQIRTIYGRSVKTEDVF